MVGGGSRKIGAYPEKSDADCRFSQNFGLDLGLPRLSFQPSLSSVCEFILGLRKTLTNKLTSKLCCHSNVVVRPRDSRAPRSQVYRSSSVRIIMAHNGRSHEGQSSMRLRQAKSSKVQYQVRPNEVLVDIGYTSEGSSPELNSTDIKP